MKIKLLKDIYYNEGLNPSYDESVPFYRRERLRIRYIPAFTILEAIPKYESLEKGGHLIGLKLSYGPKELTILKSEFKDIQFDVD